MWLHNHHSQTNATEDCLCNSLSPFSRLFLLIIYIQIQTSQTFMAFSEKKKMFSGLSNNSSTMTEGTAFIILYWTTVSHWHTANTFQKTCLKKAQGPHSVLTPGFSSTWNTPVHPPLLVQCSRLILKARNGYMGKSSCVSTSYPLLTAPGAALEKMSALSTSQLQSTTY